MDLSGRRNRRRSHPARGGMSVDAVLADYPDLERDDVLAALEYGALAVTNSGFR